MQLGAGTAVPGIVAAICGANVILSDREGNPRLQDNLRKTCEINNIPVVGRAQSSGSLPGVGGVRGVVSSIMALSWGVFSPEVLQLAPQDIILASDCFYDSKGTGCDAIVHGVKLIKGIHFFQIRRVD
jgi:predicted nicotinamide N-methyase